MSIACYGIYLLYPPQIDLRYEGLGRLLAAFIKGSIAKGDIRFMIICPSWNTKMLVELFLSEGISLDSIDIISPKGNNSFLRLYSYLSERKKKKQAGNKRVWFSKLCSAWSTSQEKRLKQLISSRSVLSFLVNGLAYLPFILVYGFAGLANLIKRFFCHIQLKYHVKYIDVFKQKYQDIKNWDFFVNLYQYIEQTEITLMHQLIEQKKHIKAWYSPTAFWPSFNQISAPKLTCVPDVVLAEFPIGFCRLGGARMLDNFRKVEATIRGGEHFVTYSHHIKNSVLVKQYDIASDTIEVIPHSANTLDNWLSLTTPEQVKQLFRCAIKKATNRQYGALFDNPDVKFFFYASQFRPSKNVITLLKAYKDLLRKHYVSHKLILTGRLNVINEIEDFVDEHHLTNDVLFVPGITMPELAACYKLADLVINPSLSEGGCPFTFTEALSVNTPVIMANIPVTREVITDDGLQDMMFFDPYDWRSLVDRALWALDNRALLLREQLVCYERLKQRTWTDVVNEHIAILEHISKVN